MNTNCGDKRATSVWATEERSLPQVSEYMLILRKKDREYSYKKIWADVSNDPCGGHKGYDDPDLGITECPEGC